MVPVEERNGKQGKSSYEIVYLMEIYLLLFIITSGTASCGTAADGTNGSIQNGDKLVFVFYLNKKRTPMCPHGYCDEKTLALIESKIKSKFGSDSFPITLTLSNGTIVTATVILCSYGTSKRFN